MISLKKENGPRASSASALGLNTIIFKHVYWYMQQTQVSVYRTIGRLVSYILIPNPIFFHQISIFFKMLQIIMKYQGKIMEFWFEMPLMTLAFIFFLACS